MNLLLSFNSSVPLLAKKKSFKLPNSKNYTPTTPSPELHVAFLMISYVCVTIQGNISKLHFWKGLTRTVLLFLVVYKLLESNPVAVMFSPMPGIEMLVDFYFIFLATFLLEERT